MPASEHQKPAFRTLLIGLDGATWSLLDPMLSSGQLPALLKLIESGERVMSYPYKGYWMDLGNLGDYEQAVNDFDRIKPQLFGDHFQPEQETLGKATEKILAASAQGQTEPSALVDSLDIL